MLHPNKKWCSTLLAPPASPPWQPSMGPQEISTYKRGRQGFREIFVIIC